MSEKKSGWSKCRHDSAVTMTIAGITRTVCHKCGEIMIEFDHDPVLASAIAEFGKERVTVG